MSNVTTAFVKQFQANVMHLLQQKGSRLRNTVFIKPGIVGEEFYQDQIAADEAKKKTTRNADTPITIADHRRRKGTMYDWEVAKLLAKSDKLKMIIDPTSDYVQNGAKALGRAMDDEIIAAVSGSAWSGKTGATEVTLPSAQKVAVGTSGLTLAKLLSAREVLNASDVDEEEDQFCILTAGQLTDLLNTTEVKSADYNSVKALVMGQINTFLGFKFIRTQRLETDTSDSRLVLCYARTGICLGIAQEIMTRVTERADKSYDTQTYLSLGIGATRLEEKKVVEVACSEA